VARISPSQPTWSTVPAPEGSTNAHVAVGPTGTIQTLIATGGFDLKVYPLPAGAATYSAPTTIYSQAAGTAFQAGITFASNGMGDYIAGWSVLPTGATTFQYQASTSTDGATWSAPAIVATTGSTGNSVWVDQMGNSLATYAGGSTGTTAVYRSYLDGAWRNPTPVPGGAIDGIGFDSVGNAAMVNTGTMAQGTYGYRTYQSGAFTTPTALSATTGSHVAVAPGGDTLVVQQSGTKLRSGWGSTLSPNGLANQEDLPRGGSAVIGVGLDQSSLGTVVWSTAKNGDVLASTRPPGSGGDVALTTEQLLTNQRISQAAVLRSNGALAALDAGLPVTAFRDGGLGASVFSTGVPITGTVTPAAPSNALGYRVPIPAKTGGGDTVQLTEEQLLINQKISQAAVLRSNAVRDRLAQGLTAAQIGNGAITSAKLRPGLSFGTPGAASTGTPITVPSANGSGGQVTLSEEQLLINQRISQAAVRRSNLNIGMLQSGLTQDAVAAGGIGAQNVTP
jgi:hypothetical protein